MKLTAILTAILLTISAYAAGPNEKEGFSGFFSAGALWVSSTDALMTSGKNEKITKLSDNPDRFSQGHLIGLFDLKYRKGNMTFHIGSPLEEGEPKMLAGTTYTNGRSKTDLSVVFDIFGSEWEDPYVSNREETDRTSIGLRLKMENIAGSKFGTQITITDTQLDDDKIGDRFSSMRREGATFSIMGEYKQPLGNKNTLTPFIEYKREARLGEAMSGNSIGLGAKYMQKTSKGFLMPMASVSYMQYDEDDVIFGKTRKETTAGAVVMYKHYFTDRVHAILLGGASTRSSNIDFYDAVSYFTGITAGLDF